MARHFQGLLGFVGRCVGKVVCDREGRVYDVWITFGSVHEVRAFRER